MDLGGRRTVRSDFKFPVGAGPRAYLVLISNKAGTGACPYNLYLLSSRFCNEH